MATGTIVVSNQIESTDAAVFSLAGVSIKPGPWLRVPLATSRSVPVVAGSYTVRAWILWMRATPVSVAVSEGETVYIGFHRVDRLRFEITSGSTPRQGEHRAPVVRYGIPYLWMVPAGYALIIGAAFISNNLLAGITFALGIITLAAWWVLMRKEKRKRRSEAWRSRR